jgi:hypothetical protein
MVMNKAFDLISKGEIDSLLLNEVKEGRTLEYKEKLPGGTDSDKKEFLADVSSFANATGGDLLYGVKEKRDANGKTTGVPESIPGLAKLNADAEIRRLENIVRDGIKPRIVGVRWRAVDGFADGPVLMVRIPKSYSAPHMVTFQDHSRFYSRNSSGKYPLDVGEIRAAFALSETLPERIRHFRDERLARIVADETPLSLTWPTRIVLHLLPVAALDPTTRVDLARHEHVGVWPLFASSALDWRFNFDGVVFFYPPSESDNARTYVQLFRNGAVEAVAALRFADGEPRVLPGAEITREVVKKVGTYLDLLRNYGSETPVFVLLSVLGVKGFRIRHGRFSDTGPPVDRDALLLPDVLVEDYSVSVPDLLRPTLDALWQAAGWRRCLVYDEQGNLAIR